ncbi:sodium:solute symporter family transporter [Sinanaerobacter chloroacetimidivorans]|jgi:SSS family solute:Na+ symporter|uniref:Sodium:solute symporter n=1 Tax=Sinanaerobacter chloroacetimidivorans TaxID=2818044 RepID=A0A8J7W238_9FIRM|nr:sodium:solute symporter [Sinanaerobacter chloroacetimidivorans]MBR0598971.1 sodium:solute symporter [Sinanaerobacter chloroacetimidivorans]
MTQIIATITLVVFVVVMLLVGIYSTKKAGTVEGFLLGGRNIGPWISAFAYGTTYFSAVIFIGYAGMFGWNIGMGSMWIGVGNAVIGCLLAWIFLAKRTRRMTRTLDSRTMPEFFSARYDSKGMKLYAAAIIFLFLVPYAAGVYKGLGTLFSAIFVGASPVTCMLIVAVLTGIYLVLGGYVATATNDFIQGIIMIFGIVAMVMILVTRPEAGGFSAAFEKLSAIDPQLVDFTGGKSTSFLITNICLTSFGVWGLPQMVHKYYAIKDESSIKIATIVSTLFAVFIGCGAYFTGSLSRLFIPADANGAPDVAGGFDGVIPSLLMKALTENIFSTIVLSVIMLLLLSASMSTLSSIVLSSSSAVSIDFVQEVHPGIRPKSQVILMRVLCLIFIAMSFTFATVNISFIVNLMSFSWGVVAGSFIGPFLWGLYSKKITKVGAWAGMLSGIIVVGGLLTYHSMSVGFDAAKSMAPIFGVSAMAVSVIVVPVVSSFTKKFSAEHNEKVFRLTA